jgi:2-oxoglutarate dehydrogenase E2 component (dihydrolipoamide succinyltransferase)
MRPESSPSENRSTEIRVPVLGESLSEATVGTWLKREGDAVATGEPVVELETEKVNLQISADASGVLGPIAHPAGDVVHVGDVLGTIAPGDAGRVLPSRGSQRGSEVPRGRGDAEMGSEPAAEAAALPRAPAPPEPAAPRQQPEPVPAEAEPPHGVTSVARRVAAEHGIDLGEVVGTGPGGRVTREDVEAHLRQQSAPSRAAPPASQPPATAPAARPAPQPSRLESAPLSTEAPPTDQRERLEERVRLSRRRLTIARRLVEAQRNAALLTTFNEIDMAAVMDLRKRRREAFQARHGVGLGFMSFFVKAAVGALKSFPRVNAEMDGDDLILKRYYDLGIAVDTEGGLVVPVVRDADRKSFAQIEQEIADLARRARENQLTLEDLRGGTFTITNGGVFGSLFSTPILNPPQVAILGMHRIVERPVAVNGEVAIRPMMYVALTYDHRIIDGREAVQFLVRIKELIEDPEALLLAG